MPLHKLSHPRETQARSPLEIARAILSATASGTLTPGNEFGSGRARDKKLEALSQIIARMNDLFAAEDLSEADLVSYARTIADKIQQNFRISSTVAGFGTIWPELGSEIPSVFLNFRQLDVVLSEVRLLRTPATKKAGPSVPILISGGEVNRARPKPLATKKVRVAKSGGTLNLRHPHFLGLAVEWVGVSRVSIELCVASERREKSVAR